MSKNLSKSATKRLPLTTKRARKGYYKGKGETKEGHITSKGRFIVNHKKRLQLIIPDLEGFKVGILFCEVGKDFVEQEMLIRFFLDDPLAQALRGTGGRKDAART